jgi:hypothetical protein
MDPLASPSPKNVRFQPVSHENDTDAVMESPIQQSPIAKSQSRLSMSFAPPRTPIGVSTDPFPNLKLKESLQKKTLATPVVKSAVDGSKSAKKSARKTPGSTRSAKSMPFRIKVGWPFVVC